MYSRSLLDRILGEYRRSKKKAAVFLVSGICLKGIIVNFDESVILLKDDRKLNMIYQKVISAIEPVW